MSTRRRTTTSRSTTTTGDSDLGELSFDDWYETPVFEAEPDERLEQLATSRRAPARMVGSAMLRLSPDRPRRRRAPAVGLPPASGWRGRAGRFLDRWADMEAASQERLEELVLPRRWRA